MHVFEILNSYNLSLLFLAVCLWIIIQTLPKNSKKTKIISARNSSRKIGNQNTEPSFEKSLKQQVSTSFDRKNFVGSYKLENYQEKIILNQEIEGFDKLLMDKILSDKDRFIQYHLDKLGVEDFFLIALSLDDKRRVDFIERLPTMRAVKERILLAAKLKKLQ